MDYDKAMDILYGSKSYEFDDTKLTVAGYYSGEEMKLDFDNMTEDMFEEMAVSDVSYEEAVRILRGSKRYEFDGTELEVSDYYHGDAVRLDLGLMTEEMYDELDCSEDLDEDLDEDEDFADAVDSLGAGDALSR